MSIQLEKNKDQPGQVMTEKAGQPTSHLNYLSLQGDHSPALVFLEGHPRGLLHVLGHQGVP